MQRRKRWERCATRAAATEAAAATAGLLFSIATQEYDELVKALGGQRTLMDQKRGVSSEPAAIYNHQNTQYYGLLAVGAPEEKIRVIYDTSSTELRVPNFGYFGRSAEHNFYLGRQSSTYADKDSIFSIGRGCGPVAVSSSKDGEQALREASLRAQSLPADPMEQHPSFCNGHSKEQLPWPTGEEWCLCYSRSILFTPPVS